MSAPPRPLSSTLQIKLSRRARRLLWISATSTFHDRWVTKARPSIPSRHLGDQRSGAEGSRTIFIVATAATKTIVKRLVMAAVSPSSSCVTVLGAGCVVDALLGEAVLGRSRKLLVGRLRVASGLGVGLSLGHEAIERSSHQLLVGGFGLDRKPRHPRRRLQTARALPGYLSCGFSLDWFLCKQASALSEERPSALGRRLRMRRGIALPRRAYRQMIVFCPAGRDK